MKASIRFLGGAGTVTGSKILLELGARNILVDCGLFQGLKELRLRNWAPFPVEPGRIDAVILTHAHLDHCGYLPVLSKGGFKGPVYSTAPTKDLAKIILMDSAKIQEEDAELANRGGYSKHSPALPLYTCEEALRSMRQFISKPLGEWHDLFDGIRFRFSGSGHILGSAFVEVEWDGRRIVFSGDLGRSDPLLLQPPHRIESADWLVVESTYGDRNHSPVSPLRELARIVNETLERKGHLIIPAFAVGRAQDLLFLLSRLKEQSQIPDVPVFLDSPMGVSATGTFLEYSAWHRLSTAEINELQSAATMVKSPQQSEELLSRTGSSIVIAGSGMVSGGRVLRHLLKRLPDDRNTILLVGFQAASTRGRLLRDGASELKMFGQYVPVRARVEEISTLSAHADQREILEWLKGFKKAPGKTFVVHGEQQASDCLRRKIRDEIGWECEVPSPSDSFALVLG